MHGLDVDIVVASDSTGVGTTAWPYKLGERLAADWPAYTVEWRQYAAGVFGSINTIQTGAGTPPKLRIWNAAVSGSTANRFAGSELYGIIRPAILNRDPDLVLFSYGHNGGYDLERQVPMQAAALGAMMRLLPMTPFIMIGQNRVTSDDSMRAKVRAWQMIAKTAGVGFLNVHAYMEDTAIPTGDYYIDTVHPNEDGQEIWADCVHEAFVYAPTLAEGPGLSTSNRGVIYSASNWTKLSAWSTQNVSIACDTTYFETNGESMRITGDGVSTGGFVHFNVITSPNILAYRNRWVTVNFRVRVPTAGDGVVGAGIDNLYAGVAELWDGTATQLSANGGPRGNGWCDIPISMKVGDSLATPANNPTFLRAALKLNQGDPSTDTIWLDRVTVSDGLIPRDII